MSESISESLESVREGLVAMTNCITEMMLEAVEGAVSNNVEQLKAVVDRDKEVDRLHHEVLTRCYETFVMQAPVARDARYLAAILSMAGHLENAGDDAAKLAKRGKKAGAALPEDLKVPLGALAEGAAQLIRDVSVLIQQFDEAKAREIVDSDGMIDRAYKEARGRILQKFEDGTQFTRADLRLIELFHTIEHIADHAVEAVEDMMIFYQT